MLIVRFKETFRDRQTEWALSFGATAWGALMLQSSDAFTRPIYNPLKQVAPSYVWGASFLLIGLVGLTVLFINGAWKRTPLLRMMASSLRNIAWCFLFMGSLSAEWRAPVAAIYAMLIFMEALALANAASDRSKALAGVLPHGA